ncbi:MAG: hypothetical protein E6G27_16530 [Actinobacteria bacterium]|nr:MAG: hypothetical protein E6G27_16530 [Actinomycetota bacterium]
MPTAATVVALAACSGSSRYEVDPAETRQPVAPGPPCVTSLTSTVAPMATATRRARAAPGLRRRVSAGPWRTNMARATRRSEFRGRPTRRSRPRRTVAPGGRRRG